MNRMSPGQYPAAITANDQLIFTLTSIAFVFTVVANAVDSNQHFCEFPDFIWHSSTSGASGSRDTADAEKHWTTETLYSVGDSVNWTVQREVSARATQITVKAVTRAICISPQNASFGCYRKNLLHRLVCLSEEPGQKYLVQIKGNNVPEFTCIKFVERSKNVVQVWIATPSSTHDVRLCLDDVMRRNSWPWIVQRREQWSYCPFVGGFDFEVNGNARKKRVGQCKQQWRPARIESECILGEGIHVSFPDERCPPLDVNLSEGPLQCWGGWTEGEYMFAILGRSETGPQFSLRLPKDVDTLTEFDADFYNSPIAPLQRPSDDRSLDGVAVYSLHMKQSEAGVCFDESKNCREFALEGKCVNAALHKYANFCKKSCGLCGHKADLVPSVRSECYFPDDYRGNWLLFETDRQEEVTVEAGQVVFSQLGRFICKSKHWKKDQYKTLSVYHNGCRPRYSCIHFRLDGALLYFQLSRSSLLDRSFDLCEFRDDPEPLRDKIRSRRMKLLLPEPRMRYNQCSLVGSVAVNVTFPDDTSCSATLSDWDAVRCNVRPSLTLAARPCHRQLLKEFRCVAQMDVTEAASVLITQDTSSHSSNYQCWVIQTYSERMSYRPWKQTFIHDRAQCGTHNDIMVASREQPLLTIHTLTDFPSKKCTTPPHVVVRPHAVGNSSAARWTMTSQRRITSSVRPEIPSRRPSAVHVVSSDFTDTKYLTIYRITSYSSGYKNDCSLFVCCMVACLLVSRCCLRFLCIVPTF